MINREQIRTMALNAGFKLKPQPNGRKDDLHECVYDFAHSIARVVAHHAHKAAYEAMIVHDDVRSDIPPGGEGHLSAYADRLMAMHALADSQAQDRSGTDHSYWLGVRRVYLDEITAFASVVAQVEAGQQCERVNIAIEQHIGDHVRPVCAKQKRIDELEAQLALANATIAASAGSQA